MADSKRVAVTIGANTYHVRRFEPFLALSVMGDLQRHLLAPLATVLGDVQGAPDVDKAVASFTANLGKVAATLDGKTLTTIAKTLLQPDYVAVELDGEAAKKLTEGVANGAFADVGEMIELCVQVAMINFAQVFTVGAARIGAALKDRKPESLAA